MCMVVINFNEIDSTNKYLMREQNNLIDFTFCTAKFQSEGKGRGDRIWYSPENENILASFLLKSSEFTSKFHLFSICTAVSVMKILRQIGVENVSIKWPNDVYVNDKKICGILLQGQLPDFVVVGIGLNVNQIEFKDKYRIAPTSVALELKQKQNIKKLQDKLFKDIVYMSKHMDEYVALAQESDYLKNKKIMYKNSIAEVIGIDEDCSLKILKDNKIVKINNGEICIAR